MVSEEAIEDFHDTQPGRGAEMLQQAESVQKGSWAMEMEEVDFQASAKETWNKFKANQVRTPSTKLKSTEPLKHGDQLIAQIDLDEFEAEASLWKNSVICVFLVPIPLVEVSKAL
uniref:Uncharacterized protein n=1 Tax=Cannabis sativa TaxID=3483 RepID=A0A803Q8X5_CANSA